MTVAKINTSKWKKFEIGHLFEIGRPVSRSQAAYEEGDIPFVASGNFNNGVVKYCESKNGEVLDEKNCITVSPLDGSAFYQSVDFLGRGGAGSAILILRNKHINERNGLFLSTAIRSSLTKYTYSDQLNSQTISSETIKLPVDSHGDPDWDYMASFMADVMKEAEACLEHLRLVDKKKTVVDISQWKEFEIGKLFPKIMKPPVLHERQVVEDAGGIPYVVRTKFDNGIKYRVQQNDEMKPSPAGVISFGAENSAFFYQQEKFVFGRDIYYIDTSALNEGACRFLTACLQPIARKYSYNYGLFPDLLRSEKIKLPIDSEGNPDWAYMDSYMKDVMQVTESHVDAMSKAIL